jgi:hypothetical protein
MFIRQEKIIAGDGRADLGISGRPVLAAEGEVGQITRRNAFSPFFFN